MPLNTLFHNIFACSRKQRRPTAFVYRIFHERFDGSDTDLGFRPVCIYSLFLLIRCDSSRMYSVDPWSVVFCALEAWLVVFHAAYERAHEEDLGEFAAGVETVWADVCVDFVGGGEVGGGEGGAVEVAGL